MADIGSVDPRFARWFGRAVVLAAKVAEEPSIKFKREVAEHDHRFRAELRRYFVIAPFELVLMSVRLLINSIFYLPAVLFWLFFILIWYVLPIVLFAIPMHCLVCRYLPLVEGTETCTARNITIHNHLNTQFVVTSETLHVIDSILYLHGHILSRSPLLVSYCDVFNKYYDGSSDLERYTIIPISLATSRPRRGLSTTTACSADRRARLVTSRYSSMDGNHDSCGCSPGSQNSSYPSSSRPFAYEGSSSSHGISNEHVKST